MDNLVQHHHTEPIVRATIALKSQLCSLCSINHTGTLTDVPYIHFLSVTESERMEWTHIKMCGVGHRCHRLWNKALTSSRTSASLLRISSCRPWNVGTLQEKEKKGLFDKRIERLIQNTFITDLVFCVYQLKKT